MLRSESWSSCTGLIDPEAYIQACTQDMCGCTNATSDFCICSTLSEFSRQCSHAGGQPPNWRTSQFCGKVFTLNQLCVEAHDCIWEKSCMKMANINPPKFFDVLTYSVCPSTSQTMPIQHGLWRERLTLHGHVHTHGHKLSVWGSQNGRLLLSSWFVPSTWAHYE